MPQNGDFVTYGRWQEAHAAVLQRLGVLETHSERLREQEIQHQAIDQRLTVLEEVSRGSAASDKKRRDRIWTLVVTLLISIVSPIVVTTILAYLHLRSIG